MVRADSGGRAELGHEVDDFAMQVAGQLGQVAHRRHGATPLPLADGGLADVEQVGQLHLGQVGLDPALPDRITKGLPLACRLNSAHATILPG